MNNNYGRLSSIMCPVYPSPSRVGVKDYARLEKAVRTAEVIRTVKARMAEDAARNRAFWKAFKARKG